MSDDALRAGRPPRILLTGRPGSGKTTVIRGAVEMIGLDLCGGFYTEEVRSRGGRIGFDVVTLSGRRGPLARIGASGPWVGRYGVDLHSFESLGVEALEEAIGEKSRLLVVDEIGKMELYSDRFVELVGRILDPAARWPVLGTIMQRRHPLVDRLRLRSNLQIIELTADNRDGLPRQLSEIFESFLESAAP
ncbi:MAG: nucleoside-triphosphatase [Gemmatimonadota bacterium]|jgi:nucleoside-triphosphatase